MNSNLFIRKIVLDRDKIDNFNKYPFNIDIVKNFEELEFNKPVTFFVGENGIGKSTFIEAIAVSLGLNPEGGTNNFMFKSSDTHSELHNYLHVLTYNTPKIKFFLRAESFYNFGTEVNRLIEENSFLKLKRLYGDLQACSHGESFIQLVKNRFIPHGLYILDEPESALSPERQMTLLYLIDDLVKQGSQFIIATHSPILISYINGEILDLNNDFKVTKYEDSEIYRTYKMYLDDPYGMQRRLFEEEND